MPNPLIEQFQAQWAPLPPERVQVLDRLLERWGPVEDDPAAKQGLINDLISRGAQEEQARRMADLVAQRGISNRFVGVMELLDANPEMAAMVELDEKGHVSPNELARAQGLGSWPDIISWNAQRSIGRQAGQGQGLAGGLATFVGGVGSAATHATEALLDLITKPAQWVGMRSPTLTALGGDMATAYEAMLEGSPWGKAGNTIGHVAVAAMAGGAITKAIHGARLAGALSSGTFGGGISFGATVGTEAVGFGAAEALITKGGLAERGFAALGGALGGAAGGATNRALAEWVLPHLAAKIVTATGASKGLAWDLGGSVLPHVANILGNGVAFTGVSAVQQTLAGEDITWLSNFANNAALAGFFALMGGVRSIRDFKARPDAGEPRFPGGQKLKELATKAAKLTAEQRVYQEAAYSHSQVLQEGALGKIEVTRTDMPPLVKKRADDQARQILKEQGFPPAALALAGRLADEGIGLTPSQAEALLGDLKVGQAAFARRFGAMIENDGRFLARIQQLGEQEALKVDPVFGDRAAAELLFGVEIPPSASEVLFGAKAMVGKKNPELAALLERYFWASKQRDVHLDKAGLDAATVGSELSLGAHADVFLDALARAYESSGPRGHAAKPSSTSAGTPATVEEPAARFAANLPKVRPEQIPTREDLVDPAKLSPQVVQHAQAAATARGLPDQFIAFRRAGEAPAVVRLDVGPASDAPLEVVLVPRTAVLADHEALLLPSGRSPGALLTVDQTVVRPIQQLPLPLSGDLRAALAVVPGIGQELSLASRYQDVVNSMAQRLAGHQVPVAAIEGQTVLRAEFHANPTPHADPLSVLPRAVKSGTSIIKDLRARVTEALGGRTRGPEGPDSWEVRDSLPEFGPDLLEIIEGTVKHAFRGIIRRAGARRADYYGKAVQWARDALDWVQAPALPDGTKRLPPRAPDGMRDPLRVLGRLEAAFGDESVGLLYSAANVMAPGSVGRTALLSDNPADVRKVLQEAAAAGSLVPPQAMAAAATFANRTEAWTFGNKHPAEIAGLVEAPNFVDGVRGLMDAGVRFRKTVVDPPADLDGTMMTSYSLLHPIQPTWNQRNIYQTINTWGELLMQKVVNLETGTAQARGAMGLGLTALALNANEVHVGVRAAALSHARFHIHDYQTFLETVRAKAATPEIGNALVQQSVQRVLLLGEGRLARFPELDTGVHPVELNFTHAVKQLYQAFEPALNVLGIPGLREGPYMTRIANRLRQLTEDLPLDEKIRIAEVTAPFLKGRDAVTVDPASLLLDFGEVLSRYITTVSRVLAFRPVVDQVKTILEHHGFQRGPDTWDVEIGWGTAASLKRNDAGGLPIRTVELLARWTQRLAGRHSSKPSQLVENFFGAPGEALAKIAERFGWFREKFGTTETTQREKGRSVLQAMSELTHLFALGGPRPDLMLRNILSGGVISFFDPQVGPKALIRGIRSFLSVDPLTGAPKIDPIVEEILRDTTFAKSISTQLQDAQIQLAQNPFAKGWTKFRDVAMLPFGVSEIAIRGAVAKGTYMMAREAGMNHRDAVGYARFATERTQTNYSAIFGAPIASGSAGKLVGQFQRFGWNYWHLMNQHLATAGLYGQKRKMAAILAAPTPDLYRNPTLPWGMRPRTAQSAGGKALTMGLSALTGMAAGFFGLNAALNHTIGAHVQDFEGIMAPAPPIARYLAHSMIQWGEFMVPGQIQDKKRITKEIATYMGADLPTRDLLGVISDSVGPSLQMSKSALDAVLYANNMSPRERADLFKGFSLVSPVAYTKLIRAMEASREGFIRSRNGSRVAPEGRELTRQEKFLLFLGFTPTTQNDALWGYEMANSVKQWYNSAVNKAAETAQKDLRAGVDGPTVLGHWLSDMAEMQESLGVHRSMYDLMKMWRRLVEEEEERSGKTLEQRINEEFPLNPNPRR